MKKVLIYRWNVFNQKDIQRVQDIVVGETCIYSEPTESRR